jgi:hypothetical protein
VLSDVATPESRKLREVQGRFGRSTSWSAAPGLTWLFAHFHDWSGLAQAIELTACSAVG